MEPRTPKKEDLALDCTKELCCSESDQGCSIHVKYTQIESIRLRYLTIRLNLHELDRHHHHQEVKLLERDAVPMAIS